MKRNTYTPETKREFVQQIDDYAAKHNISIEKACKEIGKGKQGLGWWAYYKFKRDLKKVTPEVKKTTMESKPKIHEQITAKTDKAVEEFIKLEVTVSKAVFNKINEKAQEYALLPENIASIYLADSVHKKPSTTN